MNRPGHPGEYELTFAKTNQVFYITDWYAVNSADGYVDLFVIFVP